MFISFVFYVFASEYKKPGWKCTIFFWVDPEKTANPLPYRAPEHIDEQKIKKYAGQNVKKSLNVDICQHRIVDL